MRKYLYAIILVVLFPVLKTTAQCNGWIPLGTFDSIQPSYDSASYTAIISQGGKPPLVVYADASVGDKASVIAPGAGNVWNYKGKEGFSAGAAKYTCIAIGKGGKPYVAYSDASLGGKCIVKYGKNANSWTTLAPASTGAASFISMTIDTATGHDTLYVAYSDGANANKINVVRLRAKGWVPVGNTDFSIGAASYISIQSIGGTPTVAFSDAGSSNKCTVMKLNGTSWAGVGVSDLVSTKGAAFNTLIYNGANTYVAFQDSSSGNKGALYMLNAFNTWVQETGTGLPTSYTTHAVSNISACYNPSVLGGVINIIYNDNTAGFVNIVTYTPGFLNGPGPFAQLGNPNLSAGNGSYCRITMAGSTPYVAYQDAAAGGKATVMDLVGGKWTYLFTPIGMETPAATSSYGYNPTIAVSKDVPYMAFTDADSSTDKNTTSVMTYTGTAWKYVGKRGSICTDTSRTPQIAIDASNNIYVAYQGDSAGKYYPYVKKYSGTAWQALGTGGGLVDVGNINYISMSLDNSGNPYIVYDDSKHKGLARARYYNGSSWGNAGSGGGFSQGKATYVASAYDNSNSILYSVFSDSAQSNNSVLYSYTGGTWKNLTGVSTNGAAYNSIAIDHSGNVFVAFQDLSTKGVSVIKFVIIGTSITGNQLGPSIITPGSATNICLRLDSIDNPYISYNDGTNQNKVTVMEYNGSNWVTVGNAGISEGSVEGNTSLAFAGKAVYVAYQDRGADVQRFISAKPGTVTVTPAFPIICPGNTVTLTATGGSSYTWSGPGGTSTGATVTASVSGTYVATSTLVVGCPAVAGQATVNVNTADNDIYTVVGNGYNATSGYGGYTGDGGPAKSAELALVTGVAFNTTGDTMYVADQQNGVIRRVIMKTGIITTIAGNYGNNGNYAGDGGPATDASMDWPSGIAIYQGNLYIADQLNNVIREVNLKTNIITTVAGNGYGAGSGGGYSGDGGQATAAELNFPTGLTFDNNGNMYIADYQNNAVRKVNTSGIISTFVGIAAGYPNNYAYDTSGRAANASHIGYTASVAFDKTYSTLYLANQGYDLIQKVNMATGKLYTVAGDTNAAFANTPNAGYSGDGGQAKSAVLNQPIGVTIDGAGNLYIADEQNNAIREVTINGIINTIAGDGSGNFGYSGDGGPATTARINLPWAVTLDPAGNIYIPDNYNNVVREIKVCSGPSVTISPAPDTICPHGSIQLTAAASGGVPPYTYAWSNGSTSPVITVSPLATTVYTVTVTESTKLTTTDTARVTVLTTSIKTSSSHDTICSGVKDTLTGIGGKPTSYRWSPATGLSATTGASVIMTQTVSTATTFTYTVTDTTVKGCIDTAKIIIRVNPLPKIIISPSVATVCNGTSTTLNASGAGSYIWSPAVSVKPSFGTPVTATPTATTTYTVIGFTSVGCSAKDSVTITVLPSPTVTVNATKRTLCIGDTTTLTAASSPSGGIAYTWSPSAGLTSTTGIKVTATPTTSTTYTVTGSNGTCYDTAIISINVVPQPTLTLTSKATSICSGNTTTMTAGGATNYTWAPSASVTPATGATVTATPTANTTYTVIGTSGSCNAKDSIIISVSQPFTITASASSNTICTGSQTILTASSGATSYTWSPSASVNPTTGISVTATPTANTTYTVTGINGACTSTATVPITITPFASTLTMSSVPATCYQLCNGSASVSASGSTSYTYLWSNSTSGTSSSITNACAGNYTVTVTDANGCKGNGSVSISQPNPIVGNISSTNSCSGGNNGTATISVGGGTPPYTYSWSNGATTSTITGLGSGSYTVTVSDANSCTPVVATATITQSPSSISDSIVAGSVVNVTCNGGNNGSAEVGVTGGSGNYTYLWAPAGGNSATASNLTAGTYTCSVTDANTGCIANTVTATITEPSPLIINKTDTSFCGGTITLFAKASGGTPGYSYVWNSTTLGTSFSITTNTSTSCNLLATDSKGCSISVTDSVKIGNNMSQNIVAPSTPTCAGKTITLTDNVTGGKGSYTYSWQQGIQNIGTGQSVAVTPITTTTYQVTSCCNCDGSALTGNITVTVKTAPIFTVCCDSTITAGQSVNLIASPSNYSYNWSPSAGLNCVTCPAPVATPTINTIYYVTSTDTTDGCISIDSVTILVNGGPLVFYHGITPNGDGHNDIWVIDNIETFDNTSVGIYNRWGNEVWSATNYNNTTVVWKGDDATGKPLPDATYFYIVKVNGTTYKGWVQLTR